MRIRDGNYFFGSGLSWIRNTEKKTSWFDPDSMCQWIQIQVGQKGQQKEKKIRNLPMIGLLADFTFSKFDRIWNLIRRQNITSITSGSKTEVLF